MEFRDYLKNLVGKSEFESVWESFFGPKNFGFFVNILKADKSEILQELGDLGIEFSEIWENFFVTAPEFRGILTSSKIFNEGKIYPQNPSSFLAPFALKIAPNDEILDMCAAPGGKSILLANFATAQNLAQNPHENFTPNLHEISAQNFAQNSCENFTQNQNHAPKTTHKNFSPNSHEIATKIAEIPAQNFPKIAAMETNKTRFFTLKSNLAKYGCFFIKTYQKDALSIAKTCPGRFDKILLDAPCSSYSIFNADFCEKSPREIKALAKRQKSLLNAALTALKPGGEIIYSTCTFFEIENEEVVKNALNSKFQVALESVDLPIFLDNFVAQNFAPKIKRGEFGLRILPDGTFNAFFIAKLKKLA